MARYAALADLLARASADDLAIAASRDADVRLDGALLRRATDLLAGGTRLDPEALERLRGEATASTETLRSAAKAPTSRGGAPAFASGDFSTESTTDTVTMPVSGWPRQELRYVAVAVPSAARPIAHLFIGGFDQFAAFRPGGDPVSIDGAEWTWWRTTRPWSGRSAGTPMRVAPFGGGDALWSPDAAAVLPDALARIEAALADADAEIDSRIRGRYPSPAPSPALTLRACDIAAQDVVGGGEDSPELRRWETAIAWLRDVSRGAIDLDAPAPPPPRARMVDAGGALAGLGAY